MCGRFGLDLPPARFMARFGLTEEVDTRSRHNIAPGQDIWTVRVASGDQDRAARTAVPLRWGLVPSWAKDRAMGARMINARSETVFDKPAFRAAVRSRRCLVPADCFYEWQRLGEGREAAKQPWLFRVAGGEPFAMAGIWERWNDPATGEALQTVAILTTTPNPLMAPVHDRMPVILAPESEGAWLDPASSPDGLQSLFVPFPARRMEAWTISSRVNSPRNDDPALRNKVESSATRKPSAETADGGPSQGSLFDL